MSLAALFLAAPAASDYVGSTAAVTPIVACAGFAADIFIDEFGNCMHTPVCSMLCSVL